jgi:hypothetical protein
MTAAVWSTAPDQCFDDFPVKMLVCFLLPLSPDVLTMGVVGFSLCIITACSKLQGNWSSSQYAEEGLSKFFVASASSLIRTTSCHRYVNQILNCLPKTQLHLSSQINRASTKTTRGCQKLEIVTDDNNKFVYDHVSFACHSYNALCILQVADVI